MEALLQALAPKVYRVAAARLGDGPDAEDAAQEALLRIARGLSGFRGGAQVTTWAYRIAFRAALDRGRARGRVVRLEAEAYARRRDEQAREPVASVGVEQDEDHERLRRAVAELSEDQRSVVVLRVWENLGFEEIATALGCAVSTAHARLQAAFAALRLKLGE